MTGHAADAEFLRRFEGGLNPARPDESLIPAKILGYGEISTIFEILHEGQENLAYKRMPIFLNTQEMDRYEKLFIRYNRLLSEEIGIQVPPYSTARVEPETGNRVVYIIQGKLPAGSLCHRLIHSLDDASLDALFLAILKHMLKVWDFNAKGTGTIIGLDGQLSNWAVKDLDPAHPRISHGTGFYYIDTSTPLMRVHGSEQLEPELFLRSAPSFLLWIIRAFFLQGVLDRYYDFHLVVVDLIANLFKEQRSDLIGRFIDLANAFFSQEASHLRIRPITGKEVRAYYREDAFIWRLFLALRKLDRLLSTRILHRPYPYILPGKIKR
jgi:hypothetical protein